MVEVEDLSLEEHSRFRTSLDLYGKRYSKYQLVKKAVLALCKEAVATIDSKYSSYIKSAVTLRDVIRAI